MNTSRRMSAVWQHVRPQLSLVLTDLEDSMARKRSLPPTPPVEPVRPAVTPERFTRLYRLLRLLGASPQKREHLLGKLDLDVRGFYRDLELLRTVGIEVETREGRYTLNEPAEEAIARLPFPDLHLTLGEVRQLGRGRTKLHRAIQATIEKMCPE